MIKTLHLLNKREYNWPVYTQLKNKIKSSSGSRSVDRTTGEYNAPPSGHHRRTYHITTSIATGIVATTNNNHFLLSKAVFLTAPPDTHTQRSYN
jgi:hypothetical protein